MNSQTLFALMGAIVLLFGATGVVAASLGEGPPSDMPEPVPDFVSNILGAISDFISGVIAGVFGLVERITPGAAEDGIDTATSSTHG